MGHSLMFMCCLTCFLTVSKSNDTKFGHRFAKWKALDPKCAKSDKLSQLGPVRNYPGRKILTAWVLSSVFFLLSAVFFLLVQVHLFHLSSAAWILILHSFPRPLASFHRRLGVHTRVSPWCRASTGLWQGKGKATDRRPSPPG